MNFLHFEQGNARIFSNNRVYTSLTLRGRYPAKSPGMERK
jgi:hypothetical protein